MDNEKLHPHNDRLDAYRQKGFPWMWHGFTFESKAGLRRALRGQFNMGRVKGVCTCVNDARKACVISADEHAEFVKEYGL